MDQYENNLDCKWTLWAPKGYGIRLEFDLIYLEDTGKLRFGSSYKLFYWFSEFNNQYDWLNYNFQCESFKVQLNITLFS